jgi:chromate reductase
MMIAILSATKNNNFKLAQKLQEVLTELGGESKMIDLEELELPLYTPTGEANGIPERAQELTKTLIDAKGMIVIGPEYNGSIPPIVNNAIAWVSRSGGDDWRGAFNGKFAVVGTHSGGGGIKVVGAMRAQLEHLGTTVLARSVVTNYGKELNPDSAKAIMGQLLQYTKGLI